MDPKPPATTTPTAMSSITGHGPRTMVQVYFLTIGGIQHALIGPVVHVPELGLMAGDVQALEYGDVLPADVAAHMLSDTAWLGSQVTKN